MTSQTKWRIRRPHHPETATDLADFRDLHQSLLLARGLRNSMEAREFLAADRPKFVDPFLLQGMKQGVELILATLDSGGPICIYADYDADGISGATLLYRFFRDSGVNVGVYFPDRFEEGYGLNAQAIRRLAAQGVVMLITVDCGIRGIEEVELANSLGMQVIITDHHLAGTKIPAASCTINPKVPGDEYPFKELAGVGVAYKLAQALSARVDHSVDSDLYLDLVALGTVADIVPLIGENRHLVQQGLKIMNDSPRPGIEALMHVAGIQKGNINASSIGFSLAPRINASGRLSGAKQAFELLTEDNLERAKSLAERLDRLNQERQKLTRQVIEKIEEDPPGPSEKIIMSFDRDYHQGVVGLAASRLADTYYRPAIVGTIGEDETRASARSIPGFHITQALEEVSELLSRFGGHQAAAGFSVKNAKREKLIDQLLELANSRIGTELMIPMRDIDALIEFKSIDSELMDFLDLLEPFGNENSQPAFCSEKVNVLANRTVGRDASHLKLTIEQGGKPFDAIAFRMGHLSQDLPERVDLAYHIERNNYLGYETLQLRVVDIRQADSLKNSELTEWV